MKRPASICVLYAVSISAALVLFAGCEEDMGLLIPNNPPNVRLTGAPPDSGTAGYDVEFYWEGWDSDGEVDYFIYAVDPPDMYGAEDSVWTRTDANCGSFVFEASQFDTLRHWSDPQVAESWHVFVIKAVDDMGAISEPDYAAFNATTIAPRTAFKTPPPVGGIQQYMGGPQPVGLRVTFRWEGDDTDGLMSGAPVGYLFKATDVTGLSNWASLAARVWADTTEWMEGGAQYRKTARDLDDGRAYAIAVRAIDEAGAVEPLLLLNGNMLWVAARERESFPELSVRSAALGQRTWRGWTQDTETYEVPLGSRYEFKILGNADWYGGLITGFSFGWDLKDLESTDTDPDGLDAWTPWSASRTVVSAEFTEERDYFLYVRCKDDGGGVTLAALRFLVTPLEPTKNLCYIDDWRLYPKEGYYGEPLDDKVWQEMLAGYNYGEDWSEVSWDEWDVPTGEYVPTLEFLSQFRVIVWSMTADRSTSINQQPAWYYMNRPDSRNVLANYMTGRIGDGEKGKVWAFGRGLVQSSLLGELGYFCGYPYAVDHDMNYDPDCGIKEDTFVSKFMHITGEFVESDPTSGGARIVLADMYTDKVSHVHVDTAGPGVPADKYTRPPAAELYPNLPRKLVGHSEWFRRLRNFEKLDYPRPGQEHQHLFFNPISREMTGLVPLYLVHGRDEDGAVHSKYCAFRYVPSQSTDPAEMVYFFFPMFRFNDSHIRATAKVILSDWFGLPDPDAPSPGGGAQVRR